MDELIMPAVTEDAEAIATLVNSGYRGDSSRKGWTTEADILGGTRINCPGVEAVIGRPGTVVLKYLLSGKISGCVELAHNGDRMYLGMLTVDPSIQDKGIGRKLLQAGEDHARLHGCTAMYMTVVHTRDELIAWYERRGYRKTGETKPFDNTDPVFGIPKIPLHFIVLEKPLA
ncbi:MAG: GNAT family N-acetyltransferase [Bacteroidota bacterium]